MNKSLSFLGDLKYNNNRDWFHANRPRYDEARSEFIQFVEMLILETGKMDPDVALQDAKSAIFRINRDIRFSKDKSPYKTNFGSWIVKGGKKSGNAGYYFHLEPGNTFAAGGIWHPEAAALKAVRQEIHDNPEEFIGIIEAPAFRQYFGEIQGDKLKTAPKGFPKDAEHIDLLKFKDYTVWKTMDDDLAGSDGLLAETVRAYTLMYPFNQFINHALSG